MKEAFATGPALAQLKEKQQGSNLAWTSWQIGK
jgi:hypothetical protein